MQSTFPAVLDTQEDPGHLRWGWRIVLTLLLLTVLALIGMLTAHSKAEAGPHAQTVSDPLVLAFYYSWFDATTWSYDKLSDLPATPYESRDRGVMARHIEQAQAAGIDALLVAWYGPYGDSNQTEPNLTALLDEAAARNFKIGILFETDSPFFGGVGDLAAALQHAQSVHFPHPAYLRADGRPIVFFWRPHSYSIDAWRNIRNQVDPGYRDLWISEGVDTGYLSVFDGHHLYSNTWNPPADLGAINQKFANLVSTAQNQFNGEKLWVSTVMPGYDDSRIRGGYGFVRSREDGAYYSRAWEAAIASRPDWVVITSFNEWPEGTYIEPSAAFGDRYLQLTRTWSSRFKSGRDVAVAPVAPAATALQLDASSVAEPTTPTAYVDAALVNVRAAPTLDSAVLGVVPAGADIPIVGRDAESTAWWQIRYNGDSGWIFADLVRAVGPLTDVDIVAFDRPATDSSAGADETGSAIAVRLQSSAVMSSPLPDPNRVSLRPVLSRGP